MVAGWAFIFWRGLFFTRPYRLRPPPAALQFTRPRPPATQPGHQEPTPLTATRSHAANPLIRNAIVNGGDLPLGPDDVIDYLSQHGVVTVDPRDQYLFACWLAEVPVSTVDTPDTPGFEEVRRMYAFLERGISRWEFQVLNDIRPPFIRYNGCSLTDAAAVYLEMTGVTEPTPRTQETAQ